jgi:hypothetical protein
MAHLLQVEASRAVIHPYVTIFVICISVLKDLSFYKHIFYYVLFSSKSRFRREGRAEFG